ncbi:MAG: serine--tRNA ligase [Lentisphaerae bacterium]|nr:serine--tRNA ligase [Lentisphaerota bacterium]
MLDIKRIRETPDAVRRGILAKGADPAVLDRVLALDGERRALLTETEQLKQQRNAESKAIGRLKREGGETAARQEAVRALGRHIAERDARVQALDEAFRAALLALPNVPAAAAPVGADAGANRLVRTCGRPPSFGFPPRDHVALGTALGVLDLRRAARMSGAGFPLYTGAGARLQRALINFMLDLHTREHGYTEVWPPALVQEAAMIGTGQLPKMADDMYRVAEDGLYLVPTAEVPVTNIYREEIIEQPLPLRLTAYTPCFRREAGAAGKDTRGIIRVHQFDKVELVKFVEPAASGDELESLVADAEDVLQRLGLCYRVMELCTGDLSFAAARCYDIELWAPGHDGWLEVSSCSNFEDFQARRAGIRYRDADRTVRYVHTLNGSGVALARLMVALLENGQQADGSVVLPEALVPYLGGLTRLETQ